MLVAALRRREGRLGGRRIAASLARSAVAAAVMGGFLWGSLRFVPSERMAGWPGAGILAVLIVASTLIYWIAARLIGAPEPVELARVARRRRA